MSYDIAAIKKKIEALSGGNKASQGGPQKQNNLPKVTWAKFGVGQFDIRILPFKDSNGQPVLEVSYYDSRLLSERRFVSPAQWGLPDPIFDLISDIRKDARGKSPESKQSWKLFTQLRPRERYYVPILVRGEEDKGPQIWEFNSKMLKDLYAIFAHPDYADEDLTDPQSGYDFTLSVTPTDKTFNGFVVKEMKLQPRRKPSPIMPSQADTDEVLRKIPDLEGYFKAQVKTVEDLNAIIENFLASQAEKSEKVEDEGEESSEEQAPPVEETKKAATASAPKTTAATPKKATKKAIDDAFAALDDE